MPRCQFSISISPEQFQDYYRGSFRQVHVIADDGQRLIFPAAALQRFITHAGVKGRFDITFSDDHRLIRLTRID
jgi:hypothetical protein